jgi:hypothetical protein
VVWALGAGNRPRRPDLRLQRLVGRRTGVYHAAVRFGAVLALTCIATTLCCQRSSRPARSAPVAAQPTNSCGPSGPLVFRRAATSPRDGWLPVIHEGQRWYLEPGASLCARHITQVTIDRNEFQSYDATVAVTSEGRRTMAQMTRVPGEHFAISVFGNIHSIPQIVGPIDSDSAKITFSDDQLSVWQRVAGSTAHR